jgi:hypothetical protein
MNKQNPSHTLLWYENCLIYRNHIEGLDHFVIKIYPPSIPHTTCIRQDIPPLVLLQISANLSSIHTNGLSFQFLKPQLIIEQ